jgi:enterochelin esterase-like enzyme
VGLTSPVLPYLLEVLSFLLLAGIILAWPRLAGWGLGRIVLRAVSLCLLQVCVLGLIFVTVNRSNEFYSSWSDLFGSDKGAPSVLAARQHIVRSQAHLVVTGSSGIRVPGSRSATGILQAIRIHGQLSGLSEAGHVYLPPGYQPQDGVRRYPVVVVLSDAAASSRSPYAAIRLAQSASLEIAMGRMNPVIMVMLPAALGPTDQACLNVPGPPSEGSKPGGGSVQGETFFAQDVPDAVQAAYRVSSQPGHWALLGDDSGGYCALQLAMDNSGVFSVAVAPSDSYLIPRATAQALGSPAIRQQDNLVWQLSHQPMQPVSLLFTGPGSASRQQQAQPFFSLAQPPMQVSLTQLATGNWPLGRVLDWIDSAVGLHAREGTTG